MSRTRDTQQALQGLKWEDYVKKFFCDNNSGNSSDNSGSNGNNKYIAQPCMVLGKLLELCDKDYKDYTKNTIKDKLLRKLLPQIKVGNQDITDAVAEKLKALSLSASSSSIKQLVRGMLDEIRSELDTWADEIARNGLRKENVKSVLESRLLRMLENACLYRKIDEISNALDKIVKMIKGDNESRGDGSEGEEKCCKVNNVNNSKDLICPLILLYLPLVLTSRDLCGDDRTEGIFEVSDRVACKDSISPLSDIVLGTLQYLRNLATYEFDGIKIKRTQGIYFPVCPSRTDLLLLVLLYIALSNSQQSSATQTPQQ